MRRDHWDPADPLAGLSGEMEERGSIRMVLETGSVVSRDLESVITPGLVGDK